jgi:uncharacterized protein (TIGR02391 family)
MSPVRYHNSKHVFESRRSELNVVLAFVGLELREDGRFQRSTHAQTLSEAQQRAGRLQAALKNRNVHPDVLRFCRAEFLEENCFHAVLEATKSVADKIRRRTGLTSDGVALIEASLGGDPPVLRINPFLTDTEKGEQRGFVSLARGLFGTFRNPVAHAPKIEWALSEADALDLFALASYVHRRIEGSNVVPR